ATTHWAYTDLLALCGATHVDARVAQDGNTFTGGGVTAGIDFALTVIAAIHGDEVAQTFQLGFEYDPAPPFNSGHPRSAPPEILNGSRDRYAASRAGAAEAIKAAIT
ncbi:MAG: DJ-1/PfpI family protein, partial [Pseudomonadota bacterium]